ncbi:unnamed protein product [Allacma fusca]|uniref:Carboxylesterase type B domain-containing protein n=1 Tax=Allacma fusca TaxID=39272 RepID=A0A8J2KWF3_9HEXA|nr:unnamed protein product [Allacma fusca]
MRLMRARRVSRVDFASPYLEVLLRKYLALTEYGQNVLHYSPHCLFQKRVRNIENHPVYHRLQPTDQTTTTHSLRNVFNQHREIVATKKVGHLGNSGKITLKKVKHPPVLDLGWGWKGKDLGWGWEIKENEESHKETEGWKKPEETEGWGWKKPEESEGWGWKKPEESEGWGWKKPEESEGWGWKKPEKEENELKKLIGVIGPVLFPLPFLLASLPLAVPAIGLTVLVQIIYKGPGGISNLFKSLSNDNNNMRSTGNFPAVELPQGIVEGRISTSREGREFIQFQGIPYAQPPVRELRFESPRPPLKWNGTLAADHHHTPCLQLNFITGLLTGTEDCLYLNVFVPKVNESAPIRNVRDTSNKDNTYQLLPVMVFIYGGYFMYGASHHYGPKYFMDEDVILVTFNYRVGAFGFLNTGDGVVRGNMGLKDQNMVLHWIKQNIMLFGGDPNQVTLFGESAGGSSVHFHMLSPKSAGLFHKAISQSGTAIRTYQIVNNPGDYAKRLGSQLDCPTLDSLIMVKCLKNIDGEKIAKIHLDKWSKRKFFQDLLSSPLAQYSPSVETIIDDDTFLHANPYRILKSGNFSRVPWLTGVNSEEGLVYSARIARNKNVSTRIFSNWKNVAPILLNYDDHRRDIAERVRNFYLQKSHNIFGRPSLWFRRNTKGFTDMFSDRLYFTAEHVAIQEHSKYAPVYAYYFTYEGAFTFYNLFLSSGKYPRLLEVGYSFAAKWILENIFRRQHKRGACHGDELVMLFNLNIVSDVNKDEVDYPMSREMVHTWAQFATDHRNLKFQYKPWPPVNPKDKSPVYMNLNTLNGGLIREPFTDRAKFWLNMGILD